MSISTFEIMRLSLLDKENIHVASPSWVLKWVRTTFGDYHDPCPLNWNPEGETPCGLASEWKEFNYVNPPYKDTMKWLEKGYQESLKGRKSLFLVPLRITSKYFRDAVCKKASKVWLMVGRVRFKGYKRGIPQALCFILFDKKEAEKDAIVDWFYHDKLWL